MTAGKTAPRQSAGEKGFALLLTLLMVLGTVGLALAVGTLSQNSLISAKTEMLDQQALYLAEAGWQRARQALSDGAWSLALSPGNVRTESFGPGEYRVTLLDNGNNTFTITSDGYIPNQTATAARRRVVETSGSVTMSSVNLSLGATAFASSSRGSNTPDRAKDGNTSTFWEANIRGSGEWLAMDFGSATTLTRIIVRENQNIDGLRIESSSNASVWTVTSGLTVVESPVRIWTADFASTSARYFRALFTSVPSSQRASVRELESFAGVSLILGKGSYTTQW